MPSRKPAVSLESLESRRLFAWSSYAQLVDQDTAAQHYPSITGSGVTVAVIDTGIDYTQPSLGGGFGSGFKVVGGYDFLDNDSDPMDQSGHGTSVAGVIAAKPYTVNGITYQGVAPNAKLVALRVGTEDSILDSNIERALQWVINNYRTYGISVVNLSLGSGNYTDPRTSSPLSDEFAQLRNLGIFVTAASGNSNDQNSGPISRDGVAYPAADPNVFAVGAVDSSDVITSWTQRGDELDMLAPGVNIVMPKLGGGFVTEDGTSFASPYVAGAAALIKQLDPSAKAGDIGSILMSSGHDNRDGSGEVGNTTTLQFARLDIDAAIRITPQRLGRTTTLKLGRTFDTALDSQGVLHAAYYDTTHGDLIYATRDIDGRWSKPKLIDATGDVGAQISIAVDTTGKVGIGYFDRTHTAIKYAGFDGFRWMIRTIESDNFTGLSPSLAFDIDGNAYLAYYRPAGGYLCMATMDRDTGAWLRRTIDGGTASGINAGATLSLDVGEAPQTGGFFTTYDTTVAIAYADKTNGNVKYARLDLDNPNATWFVGVAADANGVGAIDLNLHAGPTSDGLQAQIAYQDLTGADVKYVFKTGLTSWSVETVATSGNLGAAVQLWFGQSDRPTVTYYNATTQSIETATRTGTNSWTEQRVAAGSYLLSVSLNERTGEAVLSYLNRTRSDVFSNELI
jgi:subtilisin family serine protease